MYTHCIHINTQRNRLMLYVVSLKEWQAGKSVNKQEMMLYSYIYHCWYRSCQAPNCYLYATARISSDFYNCLGQYEYHYFCDQHQWLKWVAAMRWPKSTHGITTLACWLDSFISSAKHMLSVGIVQYTHSITEPHS